MLEKLIATTVWVHDQDEALAFYTEKLGMEVRQDVTVPEMGNFRWLTVGLPGQDDVALTLMTVPGPPVLSEELRGDEGARGRVHGGADPAALRHRRRLPRSLGEPDADGAARVGVPGDCPRRAGTVPAC